MTLEFAKRLDEVMVKSLDGKSIGHQYKGIGVEEEEETSLCKYINTHSDYFDPSGNVFRINASGRDAMVAYKNKPFETMLKAKRSEKTWKAVEKVGIGLWTLLCAIIGAIGGALLIHFAKW